MVTVDEINAIINELRLLTKLVAQRQAILDSGNVFNMTMPITDKPFTVSIPSADITALDTKITQKKNQVKAMWQAIVW